MSRIATIVGSPGTISAAGGGRVYAFNALTTAPAQILGINPARQRITIHNPGAIDAFVAPSQVQNGGSDANLSPTTLALGGCFRVYANGGTLELTGEVQKAWQAFSASGAGNPLTVMDSNV